MRLRHACLICGMPFGTVFGLCPHCSPKLFALREPASRYESGLPIRSLFQWRRDGWPALRSVVRRLKGQESAEPWLELAAWFVAQARVEESLLPTPDRVVLVPVPSSGAGNHALGWARALSHWTQFPISDVLEKSPGQPLKTLSRSQRSKLRFVLKDQTGDPHPALSSYYKAVIIVDDIVTTGATARAAHGALGRPRNCEVWCLMDRRPWQGEGSLL